MEKSPPELPDISDQATELLVLAGAGISLDQPCGAPTGLDLISALIERVAPDAAHAHRLKSLAFPKEFAIHGGQRILRLEHILQSLNDSGSDVGFKFMGAILGMREPNENHHILRTLIEDGAAVWTTNFDTCIEAAFAGRAFDLLVVPDDLNLPAAKSLSSGLVKLHGTLSGHSDLQPSVHAFVRTIARLRPVFLGEHWIGAALRDALASRALVISGYSGMDDFDVVPLLLSAHSQRPVVWIEHSSTTPHVRTWWDIDTRLRLLDGKAVWKSEALLHEMGRTGVRSKSQLFHVHGPTGHILRALLKSELNVVLGGADRRDLSGVADAHFAFDTLTRSMATGVLYLVCGETDAARCVFGSIFKEVTENGDHRQPFVYRNLSESLVRCGMEAEAVDAAQVAFDFSSRTISKTLNGLADAGSALFDLAKSKLMLSRARAAANRNADSALE